MGKYYGMQVSQAPVACMISDGYFSQYLFHLLCLLPFWEFFKIKKTHWIAYVRATMPLWFREG